MKLRLPGIFELLAHDTLFFVNPLAIPFDSFISK
jgi:hypothetical protein